MNILYASHPSYKISITGVNIGNSSVSVNFSALVDSGTSFTYLADPSYTLLANSVSNKLSEYSVIFILKESCLYLLTFQFGAQVKEKRQHTVDGGVPFEYCYQIRYLILIQDAGFFLFPIDPV